MRPTIRSVTIRFGSVSVNNMPGPMKSTSVWFSIFFKNAIEPN